DHLMIIGGDGTLSKVMTYLPQHIPCAYYPVGSGNDFARALKIPNLKETLTAIQTERLKEINCFIYDKGLILNSLDLGFAAYVVWKASNSKIKNILNRYRLGKITYIVIAIKSLLHSSKVQVLVEGETGQRIKLNDLYFFALANNTYFGGGITIWPKASALTAELDMVYAKGHTFLKRLSILLSLVFKRHTTSKSIKHQTFKAMTVYFPKNSLIEIDGEIVELDQISLKCQKRYLYM
ncbi:TPA: diacylglycerol kinase, partial [Streptococcus agalactiae]|nr:diacylglycerol kinase [Streptococcus agalactiae]